MLFRSVHAQHAVVRAVVQPLDAGILAGGTERGEQRQEVLVGRVIVASMRRQTAIVDQVVDTAFDRGAVHPVGEVDHPGRRGIVDLGRDIPGQDYHLIAPTATLVAREDLHPALVDLFVKAAGEIHGGAGWFQQQGQFPSPKYTEIPVADEAAKYYRDGPPFLQRYMRFWLANLFERLWVVVVALDRKSVVWERV